MSDDVVPLWKRNLAKSGTPEARALGTATRAAKASIKHALLNAFDKLGNEAFFIRLGNGSAEDKRCLAMILAKLVPLEVQGQLDATLTVKVVTQLGEREVLIDGSNRQGFKATAKDAVTGLRLPVVPHTDA